MVSPCKYLLPGKKELLSAILILALFSYCPFISTEASAADRKYTIDAKAEKGGSIFPSGKIRVSRGDSQGFIITPDPGYSIDDVVVDGNHMGPLSSYTFYNVRSNHKITAYFAKKTFTITASAGPGGSISPSGEVDVKTGDDKDFTITPNNGYDILDVRVDGTSVGPVSHYKFSNITDDHTIEATFHAKVYTITPTAGPNGSIEPSQETTVNFGSDLTVHMTPNSGYGIDDVLVDGSSVGKVTSYTFSDIASDHSIHVTFSKSLGVVDVAIPDESMKIGDVVTATITVFNDAGEPYGLVSGTVGGYDLSNFQRISTTVYRSTFTIEEGGNSYYASQDIPVANLIISSGTTHSTSYSQSISQENDPLDAQLPSISSMVVEAGTRKIGDVVILDIDADGTGYSALPFTSINGILLEAPNISFTETGGGKYRLSYVVQEGDGDVIPGIRELEATVILEKPSGNTGQPYSQIDNSSQITIDAHPPEITNMEVPSIPVGVGGTVKVSITAGETGYSAGPGTQINGVPLSSAGVVFYELSYGLYELSYTVSVGDNDVEPGNLQVTVVPVDEAGNTGEPYSLLDPNFLEVYTTLPEVVLAGPPAICAGEEAELTVMLSGRPPWDFILDDGSETTTYSQVTSTNYSITVSPLQSAVYKIISITDVNGVENTGSGDVPVTVNELTDVEILNLASGYSVEDEPVQLQANVMGGTFSGPGVISATGIFYPELAGISDTPYTIVYTYENSGGCVSSDSSKVYVLGSEGAILIPGETVCSNQDPFNAVVINVIDDAGSFRLLDASSNPVEGLKDHGDNTATIDPSVLESGRYAIEFRYSDGDDVYLWQAFTVESVSTPLILNLNDTPYCQNAGSFELHSDMEHVRFEGPGVSVNLNQVYTFDPREADPGSITITCTYVSDNGCTAATEKSVEVLPAPEAKFLINTACIPEGGEIVSFENQTTGKEFVETWSWDFGDIRSGDDNFSDLPDPTHYYEQPGLKSISLTAVTGDGCSDTYLLDSLIDSKPVADFSWISDCLPAGKGIRFLDLSEYGSGTADTVKWSFRTSEGTMLGEIVSTERRDTVYFPFPAPTNYQVELYTSSRGGCTDVMTKNVMLRPTILLDENEYQEGFDMSEGLWSAHSENQEKSWVWDVPDFTGFTQFQGDRAWFTRLPVGVEGYVEHSWVQSPCFDFTGIERPLIQLDIMRSFVPVLNGAVLQYQDVIEGGWKTVGETTPGVEWYNSTDILLQPGGSSTGWGMKVFDPDRDWVTAVHDLDQVAGNPHVTFRIAVATNGKEGLGNQGFAFDNVKIAERSKIAVLEYFTDFYDDSSGVADDIIDAIGEQFPKDVIDLQYHMDYSGTDPMNANNPDPAATRSFNYAVTQVPFTVLDGGAEPAYRYSLSELKGTKMENNLRLLTLEVPVFDIDLSVDWQETGLEAQTKVTCQADRFSENIQLYLVVFETSVTSYTGRNGKSDFRNVVLDMLPYSSGKLLGDNWVIGKSDLQTFFWTYKPYVEDIEDLAVAAFVQDRSTNRILQATVEYKNQAVGIHSRRDGLKDLVIYPNPADRIVFVALETATEKAGKVELADLSGKVVLYKEAPPGNRVVQLETGPLPAGIYILRWTETGKVRGLGKLVKIR